VVAVSFWIALTLCNEVGLQQDAAIEVSRDA